MSHTVIQMDSVVSDSSTADQLQNDIRSKLDNKAYELHERQVNDGENLEGEATLRVKTEHDSASEANSFFDWLKSWSTTNQGEVDSEGNVSRNGLLRFRLNIHDCKHLQGLDEPCEIGNHFKYDVR